MQPSDIEKIMGLVTRRPGLSSSEIATALYGRAERIGEVHLACRRLMFSGHLIREGAGGPRRPFRYYHAGAADNAALPIWRGRPRSGGSGHVS